MTLTEESRKAWSVLRMTTDIVLKMNYMTEEDIDRFLTCLWTLLEESELFGRKFLSFLADWTNHPAVVEEARKHRFGVTGLRVFKKVVQRLAREG